MREQAVKLVNLGLPIIPICSHDHSDTTIKHKNSCRCAGKSPLIKNWQNHTETTAIECLQWFNEFGSNINIGLPLGENSGYCGVDIDGEAGITILQELSKGNIPGTWEFSTGAGSRLLYKIPEGMKTKKFKQTGDGIHQECAFLCTGQQTVLPPSIHHTGVTYQWVGGRSPWDIDCAMAPSWLLTLIELPEDIPESKAALDETFNFSSEFNTQYELNLSLPPMNTSDTKTGKKGKTNLVTDEMLTSDILEGDRDNTMTAIVGHYCANRDLRRLGRETVLRICLEHNTRYCKPPLVDDAITTKVDYFLQLEGMKDAQIASKAHKGSKPIFEPTQTAKQVLDYLRERDIYLHFDQYSRFYYYASSEQGPWHPTRNYTLISRWIREVLTNPELGYAEWDKKSNIEETRAALEECFTEAYKEYDDFDLGANSQSLCQYIVVNNGMVDWQQNKLVPWTPDFKTTISFDITFDASAECPNFERYILEWLPDENVRLVLQEYLGYCLIPNTNFRKALFMYGKGRNGKSVLVEFLQDFFGKHSATLSYDGLFTRFGPSALKDKLVNIFDDTTVSFTKETSIVKNLIAGGRISAEFKGRDAFELTNVARLIYSSQETPRTNDNTLAWYDRWIFIKFPITFRASNKIKTEMQQNLEREKAGIFNWMLQGLCRLMENDQFTESKAILTNTLEYRSQNDSVTQFIYNVCYRVKEADIASTERLTISAIYKVYELWCDLERLKTVSKKVFIQRVLDLGYERHRGYVRGKSGQSYFNGLLLNKESEDYKEIALDIAVVLSI